MKIFCTGIIFLCFVLACAKQNSEDLCQPPEQVSFSRDIQPILTTHCALSGCHTGNNPEGGLNLSQGKAYADLLEPGKGYVDTLYPKYSLLYSQMTSATDPMPPNGRLNSCITGMVLKWLEQNAKNN